MDIIMLPIKRSCIDTAQPVPHCSGRRASTAPSTSHDTCTICSALHLVTNWHPQEELHTMHRQLRCQRLGWLQFNSCRSYDARPCVLANHNLTKTCRTLCQRCCCCCWYSRLQSNRRSVPSKCSVNTGWPAGSIHAAYLGVLRQTSAVQGRCLRGRLASPCHVLCCRRCPCRCRHSLQAAVHGRVPHGHLTPGVLLLQQHCLHES
jgi:hypothetical protein